MSKVVNKIIKKEEKRNRNAHVNSLDPTKETTCILCSSELPAELFPLLRSML